MTNSDHSFTLQAENRLIHEPAILSTSQGSCSASAPQSITLSLVSHNHGKLVEGLLSDLTQCPSLSKVVLTINVPEPTISVPESLVSRVEIIRNHQPRGFGANHNRAFQFCTTPFFAVVNPDIRFTDDPFEKLTAFLQSVQRGACSPAVTSPAGEIEDHARQFPSPWTIALKILGGQGKPVRYDIGSTPFSPDWIGGMFMVFDSASYRQIGGFDEGFFLYYEDVDLCARLHKAGLGVYVYPGACVIHDARRDSRRSFRHLRWHLSSMLRFWSKHLSNFPQPIKDGIRR